jgi:hypothetical protein
MVEPFKFSPPLPVAYELSQKDTKLSNSTRFCVLLLDWYQADLLLNHIREWPRASVKALIYLIF